MADDKLTKACAGCCYAGREYCNYEVYTGHFRPCPPGNRCHFRLKQGPVLDDSATFDMKNSSRQPPRTMEQKDELFLPLYLLGYSDTRIAVETGYEVQAVCKWRHQRKYAPNYKGARKLTPAAGKEI